MPARRKPTCFVIMGYGKKPDLATGRRLDLDKSYRYIIKPAVEAAGYQCIRTDEIQHAGVIDQPMYDQLLNADLVVADLSTSNVNAFFELGVRYALRKNKTVVIAEEGFQNPFDTNHIAFRRYRHDGNALDIEVVETFKPLLQEFIEQLTDVEAVDSPVYTFLTDLVPPSADLQISSYSDAADVEVESRPASTAAPMSDMMERLEKARDEGNFTEMIRLLEGIRKVQGDKVSPVIVQQHALATYKSEEPTKLEALQASEAMLKPLNPGNSIDAETIGLWAAIHKRLADMADLPEAKRAEHLDTAIQALERGFLLNQDYYNGINLAYSLNVRANRAFPR